MSDINVLAVLAAGATSYWLGAVSPADVAARLRHADLRGTGSGNPGATNAARTMGVPIGVAVGLLDVAKGFAPVWFFSRYGEPAGQVAGLAAVVGHITSPLLHGRGGKGVATSFGAVLALEPVWALPAVGAFGAGVALTRRVGIGSVAGGLALVPMSVWIHEDAWDVAFAVCLAWLVAHRHSRNLREFLSTLRGREPVETG